MSRRLLMTLTLIAVALGFLLTQQIRTVSFINHTAQLQEGKTLSELVKNAVQTNLAIRQQVGEMRVRLANTSEPETPIAALRRTIARTRRVAGLTTETGAGVQVVVHDASKPSFPGEPQIFELVHDQYVLRIVSLLSAAGARAISIDGQRYTATTSIFCAGPTIRINGVPYASPYVVDAVGPSKAMLLSLQNDPDIEGWSQLVSIKFHSDPRLQIAAYARPVHFSSIKPVKIER